MKTLKLIAATTLSIFLLAACSNTDKMESDTMESSTEMMEKGTDEMMDDKKDDMMDDKKGDTMESKTEMMDDKKDDMMDGKDSK